MIYAMSRMILIAGLLSITSLGCDRGEKASPSEKSAIHEEHVLQEYVNEPKRRATDVKDKLEEAQRKEAGVTKSLSDEDSSSNSDESEEDD